MYVLTGEQVVVCLLCYRNFSLNYVYQEHFRRVHCAEFRFSCSFCGRGFWKEMTLRQHACVPDDREYNVRKLAALRDKMLQLKALNKSLFTVVSPYMSDTTAADDEDDADNSNLFNLLFFTQLLEYCTKKMDLMFFK